MYISCTTSTANQVLSVDLCYNKAMVSAVSCTLQVSRSPRYLPSLVVGAWLNFKALAADLLLQHWCQQTMLFSFHLSFQFRAHNTCILLSVYGEVPSLLLSEYVVKGWMVRIALNGTPMTELRDVTCHMGSHSVTCHPTQVNASRPNPSPQAGTRFTYPGGMEGWVDQGYRQCTGRESNWRPLDHKTDVPTITPPSNMEHIGTTELNS